MIAPVKPGLRLDLVDPVKIAAVDRIQHEAWATATFSRMRSTFSANTSSYSALAGAPARWTLLADRR